jgi:DNA-binding response OmpR family regulator
MRVLLVEDEKRLAQTVKEGLMAEGFVVDIVSDGVSGLWAVTEYRYDVIVLDIMLPGLNGYDVLKQMRQRKIWTPVLMLTAKDGEYDQTDAFDLGADDYLTKPFSPRELVARLRAVLRRSAGVPEAGRICRVGAISLDPERRTVLAAGAPVDLTATEFDLLAHLMTRPSRVFTREELLASVWGYAARAGTRTVDVHVAQVRAKLGPASPIRTVRGVGYAADA